MKRNDEEAASAELDARKDPAHRLYVPARSFFCRHCGAVHDGTTRALDLHPDAPHAQPSARLFVRDSGLPAMMSHRWFYCVGDYHSGYAYDEACARRAALNEAERLGIEVLP